MATQSNLTPYPLQVFMDQNNNPVFSTANGLPVGCPPPGIGFTLLNSNVWTSFTPVVGSQSGTITTASAAMSYKVIGDEVHFSASCSITTNGTGAGYVTLSLPVPVNALGSFYGAGFDGTTKKMCYWDCVASSSLMAIFFYDGTYPGSNGAVIVVSGFYKI